MGELKFTGLTLSHFRSHRRSRLSFDGRPVALFGPNGAGKTNVLEAISLFSPGRGLRRATSEDMIRRPQNIGWKLEAEIDAQDQLHEVETQAEPGRTRQVKLNGKPIPQVGLGRLVRILWLIPSMDRLWIEGAEGRRRFLDRITLSFEPDHAEAVLTYEKAMRQRNRLLRDQVRDAHWYGALETQMAEAGVLIHKNRTTAMSRLQVAQENATTAFPTSQLSLTHPESEMRDWSDAEAYKAGFSSGRSRDLMAGRTLFGPHRCDLDAIFVQKSVAARECSTGEQKALLIALIFANARALATDTGAPPILLLDEVAAHLDSGRRAALFDEVSELGAQAFMTGTGQELFDDISGRAQFYTVTEDENGSVVSDVS